MAASPTTCGHGPAAAAGHAKSSSTSLPFVKQAVAGSCGSAPASSVPGAQEEAAAAAAAGAAATVMPAISGGGNGSSKRKSVASSFVYGDNACAPRRSSSSIATTAPSVSFEASAADGSTSKRGSGGGGGGEAVKRGNSDTHVLERSGTGTAGENAFPGVGDGAGGSVVAGGAGAGRSRRRGRRDSPGDGSSRGSMDTLTTTGVSTVTRGVALQWKPRLNVELGSFVYPSLMLEKSDGCYVPADSAPTLAGTGGSRRRLVGGKSGNGLNKLGRQQSKKNRSLLMGGSSMGESLGGGAESSKSSSIPRSRVSASPESTTLPPLTWVLSAEQERPPPGILKFNFSNGQPYHGDDPNSSSGGGSSMMDAHSRASAADGWGVGDDFTNHSFASSKWSSSSFEECLRAGEGKLRDEIRRLHKELKQGEGAKSMTGSGVLAAQTRTMMANDKTRAVASLLAVKGRASAVQYHKLVDRPGRAWTKAARIVSKMTLAEMRDQKNREKREMKEELKRLEKERHDEKDRRLATAFEAEKIKAKMANGRLKQIVSVEEKLQAKDSYFSQFQQAARTRYGGHFDRGVATDRPPSRLGAMGNRLGRDSVSIGGGGGDTGSTLGSRPGSALSRPRSRGSTASRSPSLAARPGSRGMSVRAGSPTIPQASDGSKRQAMARDVFIVACLELGLHPDLSQVRWNLGGIDLSHFGLGDQLVGALAASLKHSPPESLSLRDNRMTDVPLGVVVSALDIDSLMKLDLSENRVGAKAMKALCSFLEDGSCLETLILTATHIGDAEIAPLSKTLMENEMLLSLNLSRNHLRSAGASSLARMLSSSSCGLQDLDISWNCCSGAGTVELGEALKHQTSLRKLELAFNSFSDDGTMALAIALLDNRQLSSLGLSWNRVGGPASLALSRMLCHNSTLRKLALGGNPLTETGGRSIVRALIGGSGCDVTMGDCSFREDTDILFDRNYPPPLISLDLDLKNPFQCCVLHELMGLAQAKPGSKFVEVYRHSGGGRGRTPVNLQVVEELDSVRRAKIVDTATGKDWTPPDSGWLRVKFKVSRELPSMKDVLNPEAAWTAMMLIMGQESDSDRVNILRLVLRDTYVTTESGQKLIDQLSHMGIYPRDVVEMVWTRVVDASNLYEFLSHNVEHSARRDVVNILTHERFKFNWGNPTGHYRLEMEKKSHREIMMLLSMVHTREILEGKIEGRGDTSQAQNWSNFRNASVDKEPVELTEASATNLPVSGVLEFDYVSTAKAPPDSIPATDAQVQDLQESLHLLPRRTHGGEKPNYMLAVLQLQQAAARYYFTTPQVIRILDSFEHTKLQASALTALFGRTWDLENFDAVFATLPAGVDKQAASRLGYLNVLNPLKIARHYELNILHPDERRLIKILLDTSPQEKGDNLLEDHTSDLQIIDLYAGLGRLVDDNRPRLVRLWYCDIGIRGNVPNWAVREKLLDKFLVGGKPVPDRVLDIVRMYKRMAEAGYLAKEPGMGAADIAKAHERFLKHSQEAKRFPPSGHSRGGRRSISPGTGRSGSKNVNGYRAAAAEAASAAVGAQ